MKMKVELKLTTTADAYVIKNIYPLYLYDLSEHYARYPNVHGIYEEDDRYRTLSDQYEVQHMWWEKPESLFPYLIQVDGKPAGFMLIAQAPFAPESCAFFVYEFFVMRPYRGQGIAEQAATQGFNKHRGMWELYTNPAERNVVGQRFWRKTLSNYTNGGHVESRGATFDGDKLIFRFNNSQI